MGVSIFVPGDIQPEVCVIAKYHEAMKEHAGDQDFAAFLSQELVGPQVEVHLTCGTWASMLSFMGLSKYSSEGGSMSADELGEGISYYQLQARLGADIDCRWMPILRDIVARARNLGANKVVWC